MPSSVLPRCIFIIALSVAATDSGSIQRKQAEDQGRVARVNDCALALSDKLLSCLLARERKRLFEEKRHRSMMSV